MSSLFEQTTPILDDAEAYLNQTREILANLTIQLAELQQRVLQNQLDLVVARNLTSQAEELAGEVDGVCWQPMHRFACLLYSVINSLFMLLWI